MDRHIDFAHRLRWPFFVSWVIMLFLWSVVLALPLIFGDQGLVSWSLWGLYVLVLMVSPWLFLWVRRPWYRHLDGEGSLPWQAWVLAGVASGFLNTSVLEIALTLGDILVYGSAVTSKQLAPLPLIPRIAGSVLLAVIWGNLWAAWFHQGRWLGRYYRLLAAVLLGGIICLGILLSAQPLAEHVLRQSQVTIGAFQAARGIIVSVILWAMGSSTLLLFSVRGWFRYHHNHCLVCGYDRQGSASTTCPECGAVPPAKKERYTNHD